MVMQAARSTWYRYTEFESIALEHAYRVAKQNQEYSAVMHCSFGDGRLLRTPNRVRNIYPAQATPSPILEALDLPI